MDKFKLLRIAKKNKENDLKREKQWNDRFFVKENKTPNKIPLNKTRTHIKIKSRDIKNLNLNIFTEDNLNSKINITSNIIPDIKSNNLYQKKTLKQNKTLNNLLALKLHKKKQQNILNHNNKHNQSKNQDYSEIYKKILFLWEELGVNYVYTSIFNKIIANLDQEKKENFYTYEYNSLNNIYEIINGIMSDINQRDKLIYDLQKNYYEQQNEEENINYDEETVMKALNLLIGIRKYSIDIVNNIILLRKEIGYNVIMNKYDINKIFIFPNDYLVKMNNDLDFLINTPLNKYFIFSKNDPFLLKININENKKYKLPEIKEENKISLINNFENIFLNELINQEVNLLTLNSKSSFDSIFNFASKNKIMQKNIRTLNINKIKNPISHKVIKANRGLSRMKLRPKINNKIIKETTISNLSKTKTQTQALNNKINNLNLKMYKHSNNRLLKNNKTFNAEDKNFSIKNKINDDDIKIFEQFIEQSIKEKNYMDKGLLDNKNKKNNKIINKGNKSNKKKENIIENKENKENNENIEEYDDLSDIISDDHNIKENPKKIKDDNLKKQISNFIKDILEESEIENSQNINTISKDKVLKLDNNNNNSDIIYDLDNIEIEADPIRKIYSNFTIELYRDKLSTLIDKYKNYYNKIPEKLKVGFNIQSNIMKYIEGIYPKILLIKSNTKNDQILGLITLKYLFNNSNSIVVRKMKSNNYNETLNISSISCLNESMFSDILINCIDFCKEFFYFEYIILELYYLNKDGQFILFTDLEKIIKNNAEFRWVNMENDGIIRKIKYRYLNSSLNKNHNKESDNNILNLKTVNILGFEDEKNYNNMDIRKLSLINDFSINYLLLEMIGQNNYKVTDKKNDGNNYINSLISKINFKKINHVCSDFLISQIGEANEIKNFIKENEVFFNNDEIINKIDEKIFDELYFGVAMININNSFKNIIKKKYKGYIYNILFNEQINEFTIKDNNNRDMKFYLIKTTEQNTSIIIYELKKNETLNDIQNLLYNKNNKNKNINEEKNISEIFKELFAKVTKKPIKVNKNLYIPSFVILINQLVYRPSIFSDVILENLEIDQNYKINCLNFLEQLSFGMDEPFLIQQNVMNIDNELGDNIVIGNDFIISVVNNDLIFELQIPTVSSFLVKKSDWIKSS